MHTVDKAGVAAELGGAIPPGNGGEGRGHQGPHLLCKYSPLPSSLAILLGVTEYVPQQINWASSG